MIHGFYRYLLVFGNCKLGRIFMYYERVVGVKTRLTKYRRSQGCQGLRIAMALTSVNFKIALGRNLLR
jgi:hypothetical protein